MKKNSCEKQRYGLRPEGNLHNTTTTQRHHILLTNKIRKTGTVL